MTSPKSCPFCLIALSHPHPHLHPPPDTAVSPPAPSQTFLVSSSPHTLSFLDIQPLAPYHVLLVPRAHYARLHDVPPAVLGELARETGVLARALVGVLGEGVAYNVISNNGEAAAQTVAHVHYHFVPRVPLDGAAEAGRGVWGMQKGKASEGGKAWVMFGRGRRTDLDEEEGAVMAERLREAVAAARRTISEEGQGREGQKGLWSGEKL